MKKIMLVYAIIVLFFTLNCFSQINMVTLNEKRIEEYQTNTPELKKELSNSDKKVKYYHVVEINNSRFGGYRTTYNVSDYKLIGTYNLGLNNTRIVTPVYVDKEKIELETVKSSLQESELKTFKDPSNLSISDSPKNELNYKGYIDMLKTYESMYDKGFKSIDILKKLANMYYFANELEMAAKTYDELFNLTKNLEPEYYYRYSIALKYIGKDEKANEIRKIFFELSNNSYK